MEQMRTQQLLYHIGGICRWVASQREAEYDDMGLFRQISQRDGADMPRILGILVPSVDTGCYAQQSYSRVENGDSSDGGVSWARINNLALYRRGKKWYNAENGCIPVYVDYFFVFTNIAYTIKHKRT